MRFTPPEILRTSSRPNRGGRRRSLWLKRGRVKLDSAQRIADFVRHSRRHFPQRRQSVAAFEQAVLLAKLGAKPQDGGVELLVRLLKAGGDIVISGDDLAQLVDPGARNPCRWARVARRFDGKVDSRDDVLCGVLPRTGSVENDRVSIHEARVRIFPAA